MSLEEIELKVDRRPVGSGGSGARYVTSTDERKWVAKATHFGGQKHKYLYLNEALCTAIAGRLGLAVPRCAALRLTVEQAAAHKPDVTDEDCLIYASEEIEPREALTPEAARAADKVELAGIIALDALVWNTDEKPEHVLAQQQEDGSWRLWPVDHGHTLATADSLAALPAPNAPYSPASLLHDHVAWEDVEAWVQQAGEVDKEEFAEMVRTLPREWIIEEDAPHRLAEALHERARRLPEVLETHFPEADD